MKKPIICTIIVTLGLIGLMASVAFSGVTVDYGGSAQENIELKLFAQSPNTFVGKLKVLDSIIDAHPDNRPVRASRINPLQDGQIKKSQEDVDFLVKNHGDYPEARGLQLRFGEATGFSGQQVAAIEQMLTDRSNNLDYTKSPLYLPLKLQAELKEAQGDIAGADDAYRQLAKTDPAAFANLSTHFAAFQIRTGRYQEALAGLEKIPVDIDVRLERAEALWAMGNTKDAFAEASSVIAASRMFDVNGGPVGVGQIHLALLAFCLSRDEKAASDQDRAKIENALKTYMEAVDTLDPHNWGLAVCWANGRLSKDNVLKKLQPILKDAPRLEWAQWCAVFIGMSSKQDAEKMVPLLEKGCVQRKILDNFAKSS